MNTRVKDAYQQADVVFDKIVELLKSEGVARPQDPDEDENSTTKRWIAATQGSHDESMAHIKKHVFQLIYSAQG